MTDAQVRLRPITEADLPDYVKWLNDPDVTQFLESEGPVTLEDEQAWFQRVTGPDSSQRNWAIEVDGQHIGNCALHVHESRETAGFGIMIGDKVQWGKGYGAAALREVLRIGFREMGLQRIHLTAFAGNTRAVRCYEKCGFRHEGVRRRHHLKRGKWCDMVCMGVLREEWEAGNKGSNPMKANVNRYEDPWTAEVYDYQTQGRGNDVPFWLSLAEEAHGEVLEIACGTGRVLLPLAQAGVDITGMDISEGMLAVARRKLAGEPAGVSARVTLVQGDMREFELGRQFGLVIIPFSAFQVLLTRVEQRACLERCRAHLKPGARLAIDVFNPRLSRLASAEPVLEGPREFAGPDGETVQWSGETEYELATQTLRSRWRYERTAAGGETTVSEHLLALHYFFRFEMEWMLEACGFELDALYGNFERGEFTADSPELVFVARRREA